MKKWLAGTLLTCLLFVAPQITNAYTVSLTDIAGFDASGSVEITGNGTNNLRFDITVDNPQDAYITGMFFDLEGIHKKKDLQIVGSDMTAYRVKENRVTSVNGAMNNILPLDPFDVGVSFVQGNSPHEGPFSTSFDVFSNVELFIGEEFGLRLEREKEYDPWWWGRRCISITEYEDSVLTNDTVAPVPEPATIALLGLGLIGLGALGRRFK